MNYKKIRVLIAKPGLDGHDRGAKVVARALRDAGMEVIYSGLHQTPEQIVETAIQEDVDAVGLSILSGAHMTLFPRVIELLKENKVEDKMVFGGGIIPDEDIIKLKEMGVEELFTPGTDTDTIVEFLKKKFKWPHYYKNIAKSLIKKHCYKKINTYIGYLNYKLDKGFKPKDSIAAFLVDSIVKSFILPENFKQNEELERKRIESAKKCYKSIKGDCIASETINLYPYCPYCKKFLKIIKNILNY